MAANKQEVKGTFFFPNNEQSYAYYQRKLVSLPFDA
jgi:hypothetical protein